MHLVVNAAGEKIKAISIDFPVGPGTDLLVDSIDNTILNQHIAGKLFIFVYDGGRFDQDGAHEANIVESVEVGSSKSKVRSLKLEIGGEHRFGDLFKKITQ